MPLPPVFIVGIVGACLVWGAVGVWHGVKKAGHDVEQACPKVVHALKHGLRKHVDPPPVPDTKAQTAVA